MQNPTNIETAFPSLAEQARQQANINKQGAGEYVDPRTNIDKVSYYDR